MIEASIIPPEYLHIFWEKVEPLLKPAAERSNRKYRIEDIYESLEEGYDELWVAFEGEKVLGAAVTHKVIYPQRVLLSIAFWGGRGCRQWGPVLLDLIKRYARDLEYDGIETIARPGWTKYLKEFGMHSVAVSFELSVD